LFLKKKHISWGSCAKNTCLPVKSRNCLRQHPQKCYDLRLRAFNLIYSRTGKSSSSIFVV
ncbi:MAG: hypothetical protein P8N43_02765, partial [Alphaproteobacteria bacterium]|nr:hypothetical protein [Alphaproteobacteria bacterium]